MIPYRVAQRALCCGLLLVVPFAGIACASTPAQETAHIAEAGQAPAATLARTTVPVTAYPSPADRPTADEHPAGPDQVMRSTVGGYSFRALPGYKVLESFGYSVMARPGADPEVGPAFRLLGGPNIDEWDAERLIAVSVRPEMAASEPRGAMVGDLTATAVDIHSLEGATGVTGRLVAVARPGRTFTLEAYAPGDLWEAEVEAEFEAVLASITFQEQVPVSELTTGIRTPSGVHPLDEGFVYDVYGPSEQRTVIGGYLETYSTDAEFIYGLVSGDRRYIVTLYLPRDLAEEGTLALLPYRTATPRTGPSAAVVIDDRQFGATEGTLYINAAGDRLLSGEIELIAVHPSDADAIVTVRGEFGRLPLEVP